MLLVICGGLGNRYGDFRVCLRVRELRYEAGGLYVSALIGCNDNSDSSYVLQHCGLPVVYNWKYVLRRR